MLPSAETPVLSNVFFLVYSHDEKEEKFVCELFVEIIDTETWKDDCNDGKDRKDDKKGGKDGKKYYDSSCWNARYGY